MKPAIDVQNLSKLYRLGSGQNTGYRTMREAITDFLAVPLHSFQRRSRRIESAAKASGCGSESIWALDDITLEVRQGEVLGIIGKNGAGKSTLLKILSRVSEPTSGRVCFRGRVGSLLEIGTGFHHELSGRENIYLSGVILGMSRREIARKFDDIVAFAEIEQFLDTPVKRYSSGMYVRLAFAVASHLDCEILVVDEVLAVGDAGFQKKCLGKVGEISSAGRTVLFVSHHMASILNLCDRVAVLERGRLAFIGSDEAGVEYYLNSSTTPHMGQADLTIHPNRTTRSVPVLKTVRLLNGTALPTDQFRCGEAMTVELDVEPRETNQELNLWVAIEDSLGVPLFTLSTFLSEAGPMRIPGPQSIRCRIANLPLAPGQYRVSVRASIPHEGSLVDEVSPATRFDVSPTDFYRNGVLPHSSRGPFLVASQWAAADPHEQADF